MTTTATRVRSLIATHMGAQPEAMTDDASLIDDLGADSLDLVELILLMEEEFRAEISDDQAEQCRTVGDVIKLAEGLVAPEAGA